MLPSPCHPSPPPCCPLAPHAPCHVQAVPGPARSSFHISYMMQWPNPSCNCVLGLSEGTWALAAALLHPQHCWRGRGGCTACAPPLLAEAARAARPPHLRQRAGHPGTRLWRGNPSTSVVCGATNTTGLPRGDGSLPAPGHQLTPARTATSKTSRLVPEVSLIPAYLAFICGHKAQLWSGKCSNGETVGKPQGHSAKK